MRLRDFAFFAACVPFVASIAISKTASAGTCDGSASACIPSDSFWPVGGVGDLAFSTSPRVVERRIGFGLHTSYLLDPIVARTPSPGISTNVGAIQHQVVASPYVTYAPYRVLEIAATLPVSGQSGSGPGVLSGDESHALTLRDARVDVRIDGAALLGTKVDEAADDEHRRGKAWRYGIHTTVAFPTATPKNFSGDRTIVVAPGLLVQRDERPCFFGSELGARIRGVNDFSGARLGPQVVITFGIGCDVLTRKSDRGERALLAFSLEGFAMPTFVNQTVVDPSGRVGNRVTERAFVPAEWLLSAKSALTDTIDVRLGAGGALGGWGGGDIDQTGGGGAIGTSITTPRFRAIASIGYHFDPR